VTTFTGSTPLACLALQSRGEEIANSVTHGCGLVAALAGAPVLITAAAQRDAWQVVGTGVFAATLVLLYAVSTVYHALPPSPGKRFLRMLDHGAIYLLIAGTYTPFTLGVLRGAWGWTLFGIVWTLAVAGVAVKSIVGFRFGRLSTVFYLLMGWVCLVAIHPLVTSVPAGVLAWLVAGGLLYSGGIGFYAARRLRYAHSVWHLFVLAGSACHFAAVLSMVA
jgi:hemolysin III